MGRDKLEANKITFLVFFSCLAKPFPRELPTDGEWMTMVGLLHLPELHPVHYRVAACVHLLVGTTTDTALAGPATECDINSTGKSLCP